MLPWTKENRAFVQKIQRKVNRDITYKTDAEKYPDLEIPEFWEIIKGKGYGDCDDYAATKRAFLWAKFPEHKNSFRLCTCWTREKQYHAVLIVDTDDGAYMLDNNEERVVTWSSAGYKFHKIQTKDGLGWENLIKKPS